MVYRTYGKANSRPSVFAKRKNLEVLFLSLLLTALLVLTGFPTVAHAQESPPPSFDSVNSVVGDTEERHDEKGVSAQEQEALDNLESASTRNEDSATDAFAAVQQQTNTALQATAPRATEVFVFRIKVTADDLSFSIPTSGGGLGQPYSWEVRWGDNSMQHSNGPSTSAGISYTYGGPGIYRITITPYGSTNRAAWLAAFGFSSDDEGANAQANRDKMYEVESPLTPSMTRDVSASTIPDNEWRYTFSRCRYLTMGDDFTFSDEWNSITAVGDNFASDMFSGCEALTMNGIFNLPQNLTSVGDNFAGNMFAGCDGDAFTMSGVFNLPQNLANAGEGFASSMFEGCSGNAFTMNNAFNLPQNLGSVGDRFASNMFSRAGGPSFQVNEVFAFPRFDSSVLNQTGMFEGTFQKLASTTPTQSRLAQGIIGDPDYVPTTARGTFTGADCFSDRAYIAVNWGGDGISRTITISFDTASQGLACTNPPGDVTIARHTAVTKPTPDPHVDGYAFDAWYTTDAFNTVWDFSNTCSDAMTLYARFVPLDAPAPSSRQALAQTGDAGMCGGVALAGTAGAALAFMALARAKRKAKDR